MLIEFSIGNYRSFKEIVTFSMVAAKINAKDKKLNESNVFRINENLSLLKSAAIYGANASGKSNFAQAINFMKYFVLSSSKETQAKEAISVEGFRLDTETVKQPSFFQIVFLLEGKRYRYGFEVDKQHVVSEWLFYVPNKREAKIFVRERDSIKLSNVFKEGKGITDKTRSNALFLSVAAQFNGAISQKILLWFINLNVTLGIEDRAYFHYTVDSFENNQHKNDIIEFVKKLDLGIDDIIIEKNNITAESLPPAMPESIKNLILTEGGYNITVQTLHRKYDSEGKLAPPELFGLESNESEGTQILFAWAGPLISTLKSGNILLIDEFDARLHPLISCAIINLFNSKETNPFNAQLIFITHDTNLLSDKIFRRDQIWFTEKDKQGATHLYSLAEYKVSNDASFESDYIHGKYGAIPFIGDLRRLIGEANAR